ncbi:hypothetical protein C9374_011600 [Naegleria lovaniensis]|uniref:Uncharacterized protein n=1 Tax=Naegleria lovaniensis TaxID=51637 RepID=A0AA88G9K3_NAELO|nr:uncharacterized protein C9374_011600 [Naegleria lovaniensis]KAG2373935.1 hypothetical protein C9374_011600 [Naegleria lovaniensis]
MTTNQIRKNSKLNIAQPDLNLNDLLKSIDSAIEENHTSLVMTAHKKKKASDATSPVRSGSRSKITSLSPNHRLTSSAIVSSSQHTSSPPRMSSSVNNFNPKTYTLSPNHKHSIGPSENIASSQMPLKSSFAKKANRNLYDEFSSTTSSSEGDENHSKSFSSFKKKVSVVSPKTTSSLRLPLSTLSNSKLNSSRLSVKDLKDSSSSDSDLKPSSSHSKKQADISKLFENGHKALNILQAAHENMKLTIPKDLRKDIRDKSQTFKSDCTRVLSQIDGLLNKVKTLNTSTNSLTNSPSKYYHVEERIDEESVSSTSGSLDQQQDDFVNY